MSSNCEVAMFDVLRTIDLALLNDVLYNAGLRITERDRFPTWRRWLAVRPGDILPDAVPIATAVLEEIERRAGKPLAELTDREVRPFERAMYEISRERRRAA
jgi:hypothetical protein